MDTGKLDYAYRLTTARLVILRMRMSRYIRRRFQYRQSESGAIRISGFRASMITMSIFLGLAVTAWFGIQWLTDEQFDSDSRVASQVNLVVDEGMRGGNGSATSDLPAEDMLCGDRLQQEHRALQNKVSNLESSLVDRDSANALLEDLLTQKAAEIVSLQNELHEQKMQLRQVEQDKARLEHDLREQEQRYVEAESRWDASTTVRKVVYNITNIPVGAYVSQDQLETDRQAIAGEVTEQRTISASDSIVAVPPEDAQGYTYPLGADASDVNSSDPYLQYRDPGGDTASWKGDDFLSDSLQNGLHDGELNLPSPSSVQEYLEANPVNEAVETGTFFSEADSVGQETFFGPEPDRYEDLVEPGMAH